MAKRFRRCDFDKCAGTPIKPIFGLEPQGRSFKIMTIDIHTVEKGRIVKSHHVEEWIEAMKQLSKPKKKMTN
ncbi:MAG: ester cyclase [Pseudomonadota bacterium]|nr:ester cyclase [Pseudomonadota bacterium]